MGKGGGGEIKDEDDGLTFQRNDGPSWQTSDLYFVDVKKSVIVFSCIFRMPYTDLRSRENDGDRDPAMQRQMDLYGNHPTHTPKT